MADNSRRRNIVIAVIVLLLILLALLLLTKCKPKQPFSVPDRTPPVVGNTPQAATAPATTPAATRPDEVLTPATLTVPANIAAGAAFAVAWAGPDNDGDFITIVKPDAAAEIYGSYENTKQGNPLQITAPMELGTYEVRYVTERSKTILGRAPIEVTPVAAALEAAAEVVLGSTFAVTWTGPNNQGDYITIVEKNAADNTYGSFENTAKGSPLTLTAPATAGDAELRYIAGQGKAVLARRDIRIIMPEVSLDAPDEAIAGASIAVTWMGPNNSGDYITVVEKDKADGQYGNYTNTASGSPLNVLLPIMTGQAEIRYMTGQGAKVLARRAITINAAVVTLAAAADVKADSDVSVTWTGPNNSGDYITIVAANAPDGQYGAYTNTSVGSPLTVKSLKAAGNAEIRYMTGQGGKVLARIPIKIVP